MEGQITRKKVTGSQINTLVCQIIPGIRDLKIKYREQSID